MSIPFFHNRDEAAEILANVLFHLVQQPIVVACLPKGGIPIGIKISQKLEAPLTLLICKKITYPNSKEYAIAAISPDGQIVKNYGECQHIPVEWFEKEYKIKQAEARLESDKFTFKNTKTNFAGKTVILVDDGIATGLSMELAVDLIQPFKPKKIIIAVPVILNNAKRRLEGKVQKIVSLVSHPTYGSISMYYKEFHPLSDEEAMDLLKQQL